MNFMLSLELVERRATPLVEAVEAMVVVAVSVVQAIVVVVTVVGEAKGVAMICRRGNSLRVETKDEDAVDDDDDVEDDVVADNEVE